MASDDGKSPDVRSSAASPAVEHSPFERQVMACLQSLKTDMQSMSNRLDKVESSGKEIDESKTPSASPIGSARRASANCPAPPTPQDSSSKSWADTMDEEDPIDGSSSMDVEDGAGEEHDAKGTHLFPISVRTESLLRPNFATPPPPTTTIPHIEVRFK